MKSTIKTLFLIPSAYGFFIWVVLLSILWMKPIEIRSLCFEGVLMMSYVVFIFLLATIAFFRKFRKIYDSINEANYSATRLEVAAFWFSSTIGLFGLFLYVSDFSRNFG